MAFEQRENAEARSFVPNGLAGHAAILSRSVQDYFQPIDRTSGKSGDLPWTLNFGTEIELYRSADQVLIASNITPSSSNLEQIQQYKDIPSNELGDQKVAWNPIQDAQNQLDKAIYSHRDNSESWVDSKAARLASQRFPRLAAYSERHEGMGPQLISAILRNEQTYYRSDKDGVPDAIVRQTGNLAFDATIGPAQMKVSNIKRLAEKYPEILGTVSDSTHLATDKWYATMLAGAYLDQKIELFESWSKHPPDRAKLSKDERYQYDHALPLWKAGMETKALAMSYNPEGGKDHLSNVLKYLP